MTRVMHTRNRIRFPIHKTTKHGLVIITVPASQVIIDLTTYVDVESNPGPDDNNFSTQVKSQSKCSTFCSTNHGKSLIKYSQSFIFSLRRNYKIDGNTIHILKDLNILKYRGTQAGRIKARKNYERCVSKWIKRYKPPCGKGPNLNNLLQIPLAISYTNKQRVPFATIDCTNQSPNVSCCLLNAQSVRNKSSHLFDYIVDRKFDFVYLTETWLTSIDDVVRGECCPDGYKISDYQRQGRCGGGLALIHRDNIKIEKNRHGEKSSFEFLELTATIGSSTVLMVILYRPPYSSAHPVTTNTFFSEFSDFLEQIVLTSKFLLICGDFNIHVDNKNSQDTKIFCDLLESFCLEQHVFFPTHTHGHTLDLVITRKADPLVCSEPVADRYLSDHCSVVYNLSIVKPSLAMKEITYRKLKNIDLKLFKKDLLASDLITNTPKDSLDSLVHCYDSTLSSLIDKHAPKMTKSIVARPQVPWFSEDVRKAKRHRRKAERKWRLSRSDQDRKQFLQLKNSATYIMNKAKRDFYSNFIHENSHNQHALFTAAKKLLNLKKETPLPPHVDKITLANDFGDFFVKKINAIREQLEIDDNREQRDNDNNNNVLFTSTSSFSSSYSLVKFNILKDEDIRSLVTKAPSKSSKLDPIPTQIVKDFTDVLLPVLSTMINQSLQTSHFPAAWKDAIVTPLLKKSGLDLIFNNYRPVSNLSFISKLTEKAVHKQIHSHLSVNGLYPSNQSAYRPHHSTETALLKIKNDLLLNMNRQHVSLLVLLDLSAAFDTVDHHTLLNCLQSDFGITGSVLSWFNSYLSNRVQRVIIEGVCSKAFSLACGVPQGSCLGPLLFTMYISKLSQIIEAHLPESSCYADDTQLYLAFKPTSDTEQQQAVKAMELCVDAIRKWMLTVKLKLNDSKTEFLIIGTRQQLAKVNVQNLSVGGAEIGVSSVARNLGAWFDSSLNMEAHVSHLCKSSFYYLYNLRRIRKYLSRQSAATLIHAFITSRIDYCNSLLYGMPANIVQKVQRIQNAAARIVYGCSKYEHITPVLCQLHWLPVEYRIRFKILVLVYKSLHECGPLYLQELLSTKETNRYSLRSESKSLLQIPRIKSHVTTGDRAFIMAGPRLWNDLPKNIRTSDNLNNFKNLVKTHLFILAFK